VSGFPQAAPGLDVAPRSVRSPGQPEVYTPEAPTWGAIRHGPLRTWAQWVFLNSDMRGDAVGAFCRRARGDRDFPTDATAVMRHLVTQLAPSDVLEAARQAIAEYRAWFLEGLEAALAGLARPDRAAEVRASLRESLEALDRLYLQDAAVLAAGGSA
jgi:hypothetical protein